MLSIINQMARKCRLPETFKFPVGAGLLAK